MGRIELIDLAAIRPGEVRPAFLGHENLVAQAPGLLHLVAVIALVGGGDDVDHASNSVLGACLAVPGKVAYYGKP